MVNIVSKTKAFVMNKLQHELPDSFTYHNYEHTQAVVEAAKKLALEANLNEEQKEILVVAAYFHDVGFLNDPEDHENQSTKIAEEFLRSENYPEEKISKVTKCILATKMDWKGEERLCKLIKDADLAGLSSINYKQVTENLRKEISLRNKSNIQTEDWRKENILFLEKHKYLSKEGKKLFRDGKLQNLRVLKMSEEEKKKKKKKKNKLLTIGSSKSAQTQFKTALRNHIDLSSIADNKANIMLSVNAIIITVALPLLVGTFETNEDLIIPTAILALVSLTSMIFATLSTRPIAMNGLTKEEDIEKKKSNLFFFGNYFNMTFDDYENYISKVVADDEILDNSITRDLFFLGKSLGKKFQYLRLCYNFFMYGIAISVVSFIVLSLL